jgi:hypothetical protein
MIFGLCSDHVDLAHELQIFSWGRRWTLLFFFLLGVVKGGVCGVEVGDGRFKGVETEIWVAV